jgi:hypothetical protein
MLDFRVIGRSFEVLTLIKYDASFINVMNVQVASVHRNLSVWTAHARRYR